MAENLDAFQAEVATWAGKTFPESSIETIMAHLADEVLEFVGLEIFWEAFDRVNQRGAGYAPWKQAEPEEAADIFLILLHACSRLDVKLSDTARAKFEVCKQRKWGKPDERGVVRHIDALPAGAKP